MTVDRSETQTAVPGSRRVRRRLIPAACVRAGVAGGLTALIAVGLLLAFGALTTTESADSRGTVELVQPRPASPPPAGAGKTASGDVGEVYRRDAPGVVFIQARIDGDGGRRGVATGTGFVLDRRGSLLTNAHVVAGADRVSVRFEPGGESVEAEVVGSDLSTDLALLKVDPGANRLRPLPLGDSSAVGVGDPVIAIGNPFGIGRTVTTGIVSGLERRLQAPNGKAIEGGIQTDAAINPGNSGGPLLDGRGRVIGITSQIATAGGRGSVGVGFAIPVNTAKDVIPELK